MSRELSKLWSRARAASTRGSDMDDFDPDTSPEPQRTPLHKQARCADLAVWIAWTDSAAALHDALRPLAARERHALVSAQEINADIGLWRCGFVFDGPREAQDAHIMALLSAVSETARWLRVERLSNGA